jgi:hypothetical protein
MIKDKIMFCKRRIQCFMEKSIQKCLLEFRADFHQSSLLLFLLDILYAAKLFIKIFSSLMVANFAAKQILQSSLLIFSLMAFSSRGKMKELAH